MGAQKAPCKGGWGAELELEGGIGVIQVQLREMERRR